MIYIGNIKHGAIGEYCGRPSPLGNPFAITRHQDRNKVCDLYKEWLYKKIEAKDEKVLVELSRLAYILKHDGEITLLCYCAPLRCHCDTIKEVLENEMVGLFTC